jgi:hypothetical protein
MNVRALAKFVAAMLAVFALAGCATTQKIDWRARVGHYTYDQAVAEYGKPDDTAKSADGGTVADWMIDRGGAVGSPGPRFAGPGGFAGPIMPTMGRPYAPRYYMRLAFGPDGQLQDYKEFAK